MKSLKKFITDDAGPPLVKENILAFRTITQLLAEIQQHSLISSDNLKAQSDAEEEELSILDALATVIAMDRECTIATVANHPPGEDLKIFASQCN